MARTSEQRIAQIERLLSQHDTLVQVVKTHEARLADARGRLDGVDDDLEMFAQHRSVPDDLRERVSRALGSQVPDDVSELAPANL